jgi:hypothetical protein
MQSKECAHLGRVLGPTLRRMVLILSSGPALGSRKAIPPGTTTVISVPEPAELTIVSLPPIRATRSAAGRPALFEGFSGTVGLSDFPPRSVRHRRTSLDFPMRPKATAALGKPGISRFPGEVSTHVHGVCDRAGLWYTWRYRCTRWDLPLSPTASASRSRSLTRLDTRPARSPVNASTPPLRAAPHDSGPMWVATSHSDDFFIRYTSPV